MMHTSEILVETWATTPKTIKAAEITSRAIFLPNSKVLYCVMHISSTDSLLCAIFAVMLVIGEPPLV